MTGDKLRSIQTIQHKNICRTSTIITLKCKINTNYHHLRKLLFTATRSYFQLLWTFCLTFWFHTLLWARVLCLLRNKRYITTWLCKYFTLTGLLSASMRRPSVFIARLLLMACPCQYDPLAEFLDKIILSCLSVWNNDAFICFK